MDSYSEQELYQNNECTGAGTPCGNVDFGFGSNFIDIVAENQAEVESEAYQTLVQDNDCANGESCILTGVQGEFISATEESFVDSYSEQELIQNNECDGAACVILEPPGVNAIFLSAANQAVVENEAYQTLVQDDICSDGAECINAGTKAVGIFATDNSFVDSYSEQEAYQNNECTGVDTQCINFVEFLSSNIFLTASEQAAIENEAYQKFVKDNICADDASCDNAGSNTLQISATEDRLCRFLLRAGNVSEQPMFRC